MAGQVKVPDHAIRKDHPPDVDYDAEVEPKHKAFVLWTDFWGVEASVISAVLMEKHKIYIPAAAIEDYLKQARREASLVKPYCSQCVVISLIGSQVKDFDTFLEMCNFMPREPDDPKFSGVTEVWKLSHHLCADWIREKWVSIHLNKNHPPPETKDPELKSWLHWEQAFAHN